jgi:hypothetical protein
MQYKINNTVCQQILCRYKSLRIIYHYYKEIFIVKKYKEILIVDTRLKLYSQK